MENHMPASCQQFLSPVVPALRPSIRWGKGIGPSPAGPRRAMSMEQRPFRSKNLIWRRVGISQILCLMDL